MRKILLIIIIILYPFSISAEENKKVIKFGHAYGESSAVIFKKYAPLISSPF